MFPIVHFSIQYILKAICDPGSKSQINQFDTTSLTTPTHKANIKNAKLRELDTYFLIMGWMKSYLILFVI